MTEPRIFTLDEARRALPLVKRIASDIQQAVERLEKLPDGLNCLYGTIPIEQVVSEQRDEIAALRDQLDELFHELTEIGVELKGLQPVLVDFPTLRDNEPAYLCWANGEDGITHWHSLSSGFAGRATL